MDDKHNGDGLVVIAQADIDIKAVSLNHEVASAKELFKGPGVSTGGATNSKKFSVKVGETTRDAQSKKSTFGDPKRAMTGVQTNYSDVVAEIIASCIAAKAMNGRTDGVEVSPITAPVVYESRALNASKIGMYSVYLNSDKDYITRTYDQFFDDMGGTYETKPRFILPDKEKKHVTVNFDSAADKTELLKKGELVAGVDYKYKKAATVKLDKYEIAKSMKMSLCLMDHDVNPGNMMVMINPISGQSIDGRIDYGNAFNNMIKPLAIRGYKKNGQGVLHALNIDKINDRAGTPKFWRDYKNVCLDEKFIKAFREDNIIPSDVTEGLNEARKQLKGIVNKGDNGMNTDLETALKEIIKNIEGVEYKPQANTNGGTKENRLYHFIDHALGQIETKVLANIEEAKSVGNLLKIQSLVDQVLKDTGKKMNIDDVIKEIADLYAGDKGYLLDKKVADEIQWVRVEWSDDKVKNQPFKGTLSGYIVARSTVVGINGERLNRLVSGIAAISEDKNRDNDKARTAGGGPTSVSTVNKNKAVVVNSQGVQKYINTDVTINFTRE
ncbi:MAG: hypothetical protein ACHP6I_03490 [Rickettsiales bacterium]